MGVAQYLDGSKKHMEFGFNAWLVVWNMAFILSIYWECHHPN